MNAPVGIGCAFAIHTWHVLHVQFGSDKLIVQKECSWVMSPTSDSRTGVPSSQRRRQRIPDISGLARCRGLMSMYKHGKLAAAGLRRVSCVVPWQQKLVLLQHGPSGAARVGTWPLSQGPGTAQVETFLWQSGASPFWDDPKICSGTPAKRQKGATVHGWSGQSKG